MDDDSDEKEHKLFIGMIPKTFTEESLYNIFFPYGELREVHIIRGPEGTSKGCAFIKFTSQEAALVAIHDMHEVIPTVSDNTASIIHHFALTH